MLELFPIVLNSIFNFSICLLYFSSGEGEKLSGFEIAIKKLSKSNNQQYSPGSISPFIRTWRCSLLFPVEDPQLIADKYWNDRLVLF